jgi:hypothetical protein
MTGKVINIDNVISKDEIGCRVADYWTQWRALSATWRADVEEIRKYLFQTDTTQTANSKLPWKNKTSIPKLCQTRDNLFANYMAALYSKRNWLEWEAGDRSSNSRDKRDAILAYMTWVIQQDRYKTEMAKCVLDYIDYGNVFGTVEWVDERQMVKGLTSAGFKAGYVGPAVRRISPLDIVFNPIAPSFQESPKIVRSLVSMGEVKKLLDSETNDENREANEALFKYLQDIRVSIRQEAGSDLQVQDAYLQVDGFSSYRAYLDSEYVEILTFYGDIWNRETGEFLQNHVLQVVDRHKVLVSKTNPSFFGTAPIFHVGWRVRQDNLWAMSPLANLVGLQYRLDHVENLKADVFDLITAPPLKIKGYVENFQWEPMAKIFCGDEGDVEMMAPPFNILTANIEIQYLASMIEEMAGAPKEALGFRTPGEKTAYEVQRQENASSRIFINKTSQFQEQFEERLLNAGLEMARRNVTGVLQVPGFDDQYKVQVFTALEPKDLVGVGRVKPVSARHFAEKAELVQNLNNFYMSGPGQDPEVRQHVSSVKTAEMVEDLLDWEQYDLISPYVRVAEQLETQRLQQVATEDLAMEAQTPTGLTPDDHDASVAPVPEAPPMMEEA